jgi:hypothetical protein
MQMLLNTIKQEVMSQRSIDPWEKVAQSTKSQKSQLKKHMKMFYDNIGVTCMVTGTPDRKDQGDGFRVVAAHLWPFSGVEDFSVWQSQRKETILSDGIDDPRNGMFLLRDIEHAYDNRFVIFVCNPFTYSMQLKVLNPGLKGQKPRGCDKTFAELEEIIIQEPTISNTKRPSFKIISYHARRAVTLAKTGWLSLTEKDELLNRISICSPGDEDV